MPDQIVDMLADLGGLSGGKAAAEHRSVGFFAPDFLCGEFLKHFLRGGGEVSVA